jgi:hypothetical protein
LNFVSFSLLPPFLVYHSVFICILPLQLKYNILEKIAGSLIQMHENIKLYRYHRMLILLCNNTMLCNICTVMFLMHSFVSKITNLFSYFCKISYIQLLAQTLLPSRAWAPITSNSKGAEAVKRKLAHNISFRSKLCTKLLWVNYFWGGLRLAKRQPEQLYWYVMLYIQDLQQGSKKRKFCINYVTSIVLHHELR